MAGGSWSALLLQDTELSQRLNMAAAVVDGVSSMAKHMFDGLVNEYYGRKKGQVKPWTKAHVRRVIQFINGANLAYEIGLKRSNAEIYFSKCYEVLSVDGVQRVVTKKARDDGSVKIMLAKEEYFDILQSYHEKMGHVGYDKLCSVVRERFTLPRHVIGMFVSCCNICKHCKVPAGIRTIRKRKASSVTSKGSSGKASPFLKSKEKTQNSVSSFDRLPDSNFLNVEDSESSGDFDLRDLRGNFVASMQYSPRVPQAPPATQKQSAPPQQPPPSQKMVPPQQVSAPKQIAPKPTSTPVSPLQPLPPPPEVCLRWNSYHSNMQATFPSLLNNEQFVDVTLACEGRSIKCHKMMLSACSAYFEELLSQNPCQHPIVLMKDLKYWEVQALVDFMYRGEVNVAQDKLPSLLAAAEALQIKGLAGPAFSSHDDENTPSSAPLSSAEDYLDESTPSPSGSRRARKRRVMSSTQSPRTQAVQSPQVPVAPTRSTTGKRTVKPSLSMPSTSNYQHESSNLPSEPPARRARKSESGELEIKIEPIDIEISNDSMDQMDDSFMEKTFDDAEAGDGGESSGQGDDPGGTSESKPSISSDTRMNVHGHDAEQMDFGNNSGTSRNDQNFRYEDSGSQDGMSAVPDLPGTSYQESLSQPSSSGINSSDNLLGRM